MKRRFEFGILSARFADGIPLVRRLLRAVALAIVVSGSLVLVLGAGLFVLSQTTLFNRWLAQVAESLLRDQLHGELQIGSLEVQLFQGVHLENVRLIADGDTVLATPRIDVGYMPEALLFRTIAARVVIDSLHLWLVRYQDSSWNVDRILKPPSNRSQEPPPLVLYIRSLELRNATITTSDQLTAPSQGQFDPLHAELENVELRATVLAHLRQQQYSMAIDHFSWRDRRSGLRLNDANGVMAGDTSHVDVAMLRLALPHSDIRIEQASVELQSTSAGAYDGRIVIAHLDTADSRYLLPPEIRLGRSLSAEGVVRGTSDRLAVTNGTLRIGQTVMHGTLELESITSSRQPPFSASIERSQGRWSDIVECARWLELPSPPGLDVFRIERLTARGTADSVTARVQASVPAARVDVALRATLGMLPTFELRGSIAEVNLAAIDRQLPQTNLNATIEAAGTGTTIPQLRGYARVWLGSSQMAQVPLESGFIAVRMDKATALLDTLDILFDSRSIDTVCLRASGSAELKQPYGVTISLEGEHLPLRTFTGSELLPELLSLQLRYRSQGAQLDSLRAQLSADIQELVFQDRAIFPFHVEAMLDFDEHQQRVLMISSPQIQAQLSGRFTLEGLGRVADGQRALAEGLIREIRARALGEEVEPCGAVDTRDTLDVAFSFRVQSLSLLAPLVAPAVLEARGEWSGKLSARGATAEFALDTIAIEQLIVATPDGNYLATMPTSGTVRIRYRDLATSPRVEYALLRGAVDSVVRVGQLRVVRPALEWEWDGQRVHLETGTAWLENMMPVQCSATIIPQGEVQYAIEVASARLGLSDDFSWKLTEPLRVQLAGGRYAVQALRLGHEQSAARVEATGTIWSDGAEDLLITLRTFDLNQLQAIPALQGMELASQLGGMIDSTVVQLTGPWTRPRIAVVSAIKGLSYGGIAIGDQELTLNYDDSMLKGAVTLFTTAGTAVKRTALDIRIQQLPLDVRIVPPQVEIRSNEPIAIVLTANDLSLAVVEPFFPAVSQLRGTASALLTVSGTLPGAIRFAGKAQYDQCEFLVPATNIRYRSRGVLSLEDNVLRLDTIELFNDPADLVGGVARLGGTVTFRGFQPDQLDISIRIPGDRGFLVMSNATAAVNNTMYGRLVISTEEEDRMRRLHLSGSIDQPRIGGFVHIEEADITFPPTVTVNVQTSNFVYRKTGEGYYVSDAVVLPRRDTTIGDLPPRNGVTTSAPRKISIAPGFSELLYTEVDVKIRRQMRIKMDFSGVEQLVAFVEQEHRRDYLRFVREGNRRTELRGALIVNPSSTYKFYSTFSAGGRLRFTTGQIDNPEVDLQAVYAGERIVGSDNRREPYRVILFISGTKKQPRLRMTYEINGETAPGMRGDSVRIMTNALLLVLFGRTQEELTGGTGGQSVATSALSQSVSAAQSAAISAFLTNALQGGVIKNVNIDFGSSDVTSLSQARIMLTGQLFGANVTVGGSVSDLSQNSQITLDLSIGNTLGIEWLRNLVAQFQATANPGQSLSRQQKQWEFRLGWRVP
jgi:hypothetical protein